MPHVQHLASQLPNIFKLLITLCVSVVFGGDLEIELSEGVGQKDGK